jgi:tetratricopeptide (TPR) repeat protein
MIAYGSLSWYQELYGNFADALASSSEALKLDSSNQVAKMNHAHALLFLGRAKEAEPIYAAGIGTKMTDGQYWDAVVLDDLGTLEAQGFTNPDVAHIRTLMRRPGYERQLAEYTQALKTNPNDADAISHIPEVYFRLDRWKEAVDAQKIYIAALQRRPNHDRQWASTMSGADVALAWYQIFNRDFAGALAASDEALKLDPKSLIAQTNRAHALLFLGRTKEAEAIYLGHRGENVFANSDEKWETAILGDFDDLEKAGLTNPNIARLRALLRAAAK